MCFSVSKKRERGRLEWQRLEGLLQDVVAVLKSTGLGFRRSGFILVV